MFTILRGKPEPKSRLFIADDCKPNAEIAAAAEGRRESHTILVDSQDFNGTFHVNSLRNGLWCVGCVFVVDRIPSTVSLIQRDCHSLENLCLRHQSKKACFFEAGLFYLSYFSNSIRLICLKLPAVSW